MRANSSGISFALRQHHYLVRCLSGAATIVVGSSQKISKARRWCVEKYGPNHGVIQCNNLADVVAALDTYQVTQVHLSSDVNKYIDDVNRDSPNTFDDCLRLTAEMLDRMNFSGPADLFAGSSVRFHVGDIHWLYSDDPRTKRTRVYCCSDMTIQTGDELIPIRKSRPSNHTYTPTDEVHWSLLGY